MGCTKAGSRSLCGPAKRIAAKNKGTAITAKPTMNKRIATPIARRELRLGIRCFSSALLEYERRPECRLTAYEFSGNTAANAAVLSAATRG